MPVQCICPACGTVKRRPPSKGHQLYCSMRCAKLKPREPLEIDATGTARIPLRTRSGDIRAHALIDAADAEWAAQWRWCLDSDGYAVRSTGHGPLIRLHRELLGLTGDASVDVDHIDRTPLNNRRSNLRVLPRGGNAQNRKARTGASSSHRGVGWNRGAWQATIWSGGRLHYLGRFASEEDAAEAARAARARLMPYATN